MIILSSFSKKFNQEIPIKQDSIGLDLLNFITIFKGVLFMNEATTVLSSVVTANMLQGVLAEVTSLLPIVIPVMIGFMAIRKGIAFLQNILHSA